MGTAIRIRDDYRMLSGPEKAAIIFLSLGDQKGARLMERLDGDEIRMVSRAMASLGTITSELVEMLLRSFSDHFANTGSVIGTYDSTERMLGQFLSDDRVMEIMSEIRGPAGRTMWEKLSNVNEQVLASYLEGEYPQTVAVVLSRIRASHAAKVLPLLPEPLIKDVVQRMIRMQFVQREVLEDVEDMLHSEFMANYARTHGSDSHVHMAEIFNQVDREALDTIMGSLEVDLPDSAALIRSLMFTFDDLAKLDPLTLQLIMRGAEMSDLAIALKGVREEIREVFIANMSERAGAIIRDELDNMGPARLPEVKAAQAKIVKLAKDMADNREITLTQGAGAADEYVY